MYRLIWSVLATLAIFMAVVNFIGMRPLNIVVGLLLVIACFTTNPFSNER